MTESKNAIKIDKLSVFYRHTPALSGVCLELLQGEYLGVIGPNGGGKTTLLKSILGMIPVSAGQISILGGGNGKNREFIGYVPQYSEVDRLFPISVKEVVMTACLKGTLHPFFRYRREHEMESLNKLVQVGLLHLAHRQVSELSGGEFQRMLIARALATKPKILLLDEPTASVDPVSRERIYEILDELRGSVTIIMVSHDLGAIASRVTKIAYLDETLRYFGPPDLKNTELRNLCNLGDGRSIL